MSLDGASHEALAAAGQCSWETSESDESANILACADLFSMLPVRLTLWQGTVVDQSLLGDGLSLKELRESLEISVKATGYHGQSI